MIPRWLAACATAALFCFGCATQSPPQATTARKMPAVNLAGFPPAYKEGYGDACSDAKNTKRFKSDQQYAQGWRDGLSLCRKR